MPRGMAPHGALLFYAPPRFLCHRGVGTDVSPVSPAGFTHGLAIKEELEDYYEKEIHHGRLYPNLDTLVEKGLVEKGQRDRRTNYYC
ncbi:MAG: helix-turn-helix transcriptional regulator [Pirellulaceae bacterium]